MFEDAHKIIVSEESCEECQSALLDIEFNKVILVLNYKYYFKNK